MSKRRTYSREFKLEALRLWQTTEKSAREVEEDLGITRGLLYKWKRKFKAEGEKAFPGKGTLDEISVHRGPPGVVSGDPHVSSAQRLAQRVLCLAPAGLIHHSDCGSQYTASEYQELLTSNLMLVSMSSTGNCYDNAPMESFLDTLKTEWTQHRSYRTRREAKTDIFFYVEGFYNRRRRHSALDYVSPHAFERAYFERQQLALTPCL
jgi:transposase InsO family protein